MMGDFEKDLRDALEGAEFAPSERVWHGVQSGLAPKKKRGLFYMWQTYGVAAAVLFLLTMGYLFRDELFSSQIDPQTKELTQNDGGKSDPGQPSKETAKPGVTENAKQTAASDSLADSNNPESVKDQNSGSNGTAEVITSPSHSPTTFVASTQQKEKIDNQVTGDLQLEGQPSTTLLIDPTAIDLLTLGDMKEGIAEIRFRWEHNNLVQAMNMEFVADRIPDVSVNSNRRLLNGSLASGNFNPNSSISNQALASSENSFNDQRFNNTQTIVNEEESQLGSLSVGFGLGLPLGERWMIKTGLRYSQYRFASTSNAYAVEAGQSLPVYSKVSFDNSNVLYAGEYELTNTLHSISVPVQVSFRAMKINKFSTWVNMGVAADYFVSYVVKGNLNFLEARKVDFSQTNFLNRFNVNALTGLELAYELNNKFALSGQVFYRQYLPLSGTSEGAYEATPSFFGFGLGVNYYLKEKK